MRAVAEKQDELFRQDILATFQWLNIQENCEFFFSIHFHLNIVTMKLTGLLKNFVLFYYFFLIIFLKYDN